MNRRLSIHIKAFVLLAVFLTNTVVSFACSVSGAVHNSHHAKTPAAPSHAHGKHDHEHKKAHTHDHNHDHGKAHKHNHDSPAHKHDHGNKQEKEGGDCCSDDVVKIQQVDKSVSKHINVPAPAISTIDLVLLYAELTYSFIEDNKHLRQHLRWPPPTIPDIRIAIQSFQI